VNNLDLGGGALVTGLASADQSGVALQPLPFPFFGPAFPLGPSGPPVLAPHGPAVFTADGKTALVENWVIPPLADAPLVPSITVLTGFDSGRIQVASHLLNPVLNTFDNNQQIATAPSGLLDYVNLYLSPGATRDRLTSIVNQAITASDRGDPPPQSIALLAQFIREAIDLLRRGELTASQATTLGTLATIGIQALTGPVTTLSGAVLIPGAVAPESIAALRGLALGGTQPRLTIVDSVGNEFDAAIAGTRADGLDYLVPRGAAIGKAIAIVSNGEGVIGATSMEIESVKVDGSQSYEAVEKAADRKVVRRGWIK
jgi:hypothetical protein